MFVCCLTMLLTNPTLLSYQNNDKQFVSVVVPSSIINSPIFGMIQTIKYIILQVLSLGPSKGKITKLDETQPKDKKQELYKTITSPSALKRKTLILDLDETLVHSTIKTVTHHHITVDVMIDGLTCTFYVIKRPHVDLFLKKV